MLSLCIQLGDEEDEDISAAMMDKISRRLDAMPSDGGGVARVVGAGLRRKRRMRRRKRRRKRRRNGVGGSWGDGQLRGTDGMRRQVP